MVPLRSIQILRFVAAFGVLLLHADRSIGIGAAGVDIFFVISGFIICRIAAGRQPGAFLLDRVRRIYPIYWLASVPAVLLYFYAGRMSWGASATSVTLWPVWGDYLFPYLRPAWTLSFEMLFYIAAAVLLWRPRWLGGLIATYIGCLVLAFATGLPLLRFVGNPMIAEFLLGAMIARAAPLRKEVGAGLLVLSMVAFVGSAFFADRYIMAEDVIALTRPLRPLLWGPPSALLVLGALQLESVIRGRVAALLTYLGDASYSIYLVQLPMTLVLNRHLPVPIVVGMALVMGVGLHRYVEAPLLKFLKRRRNAPRAELAIATP